ncbi:AraC family ligand binding domain-containing protein [Vibrio ulleungensis]|uniref:AraC family ligand binding domain-containing protein n=1 Tax=Vibrio ulleungensis TaxID=2807619 RepID=A0ABS2HNF7_9VIBR|nr:AraC family ligand binding domain-containing protein [Vibrio ulleungensis]
MESKIRDIRQDYWTSRLTPYLTVRTTRDSAQGYKAHYHPELSIGSMLDGQTCLSLYNSNVILNEGDAIFIEPIVVHACNPVDNTPALLCDW